MVSHSYHFRYNSDSYHFRYNSELNQRGSSPAPILVPLPVQLRIKGTGLVPPPRFSYDLE